MMWAIDNVLKRERNMIEEQETGAVVRSSELAVFVAFTLIEI